MTGYHDYVLGLIPAALLGITGLLSLAGLPVEAAVPVGGAASALLIAHAMFVRGPGTTPVSTTSETNTAAALNAD